MSTLYWIALVPAPNKSDRAFVHHTKRRFRIDFCAGAMLRCLRLESDIVTFRIGFRDTFLSSVNTQSNRNGRQR